MVPLEARRLPARTFARRERNGHALSFAAPAQVAPRLTGRVAALLAQQRPVDLVWRSDDGRSAPTTGGSRTAANVVRGQSAYASAAAPPPATGRRQEPGIVSASALDPSLVNRLADDVIRRIDRRARIERERRGLL
jgi:hypothetical protein